jgi:hypothetical protein
MPTTSNPKPTAHKRAIKRARSSSLPSPRHSTSSSASQLAVHDSAAEDFDPIATSLDFADDHGLSSAPARHPLLTRRSNSESSSDSCFVSALNRHPGISLFVAHSPRSDLSLLCDETVLSAFNDAPSPHHQEIAASREQPTPLSRLKVPVFFNCCLPKQTSTLVSLCFRSLCRG